MEFKLQDLATIALGAPDLTNVNIAVLHSLIEILLKKLNCQNETVALSCFESKQLQKILEHSKISPLAFNDEHVEMVGNKLERLQKLEQDMENLDTKLSCHLRETQRESNLAETKLNWDNWETFGAEDLCTLCEPDNDIACKLLKNTDFLKKLLRRISAPMVDRVFHLENKLKTLQEEFTKFIARTEEEYLKIQLLETCIYEIELLRKKINENQTQFICTMEEVQDMLDAKLDKIHMPALKKYIKDNFQKLTQHLQALQTREECPRAAGIIMEGIRCMSCGSTHVCSEVGVLPTAILPDAKIDKTAEHLGNHCSFSGIHNFTQNNLKSKSNPEAKSRNIGNDLDTTQSKTTRRIGTNCGKSGDVLELLEGFDGNLYRKG